MVRERLVDKIKAALFYVKTSKFFQEFSRFAASTIAQQASRVVSDLAVAKILGPVAWGYWYLLNLFLSYGAMTHLGVLNGMNREVPKYQGKDDIDQAEEIVRVALGFLIVSCLVTILVVLPALLILADNARRTSLILIALLLIVQQGYSHFLMYLKSTMQFLVVSRQQLILAILYPLFTIPLAFFAGLSGFITGQSIALLLLGSAIWHRNSEALRPKLEIGGAFELIRVGFPIMLVGMLYTFLTTVDRWIIVAFAGVEQLGYYSLAIITLGALSLIPLVVAQQIYPRMSKTWGEKESYDELVPWIHRQTTMTALITLPTSLGAFLAIPIIVNAFLPEYAQGLTAVKIACIAPLFLIPARGYANFLNVVDKQVYYLIVLFIGIILNLLLSTGFIYLGLGINGVALGTTLTYAFFGLGLYLIGRSIIVTSS